MSYPFEVGSGLIIIATKIWGPGGDTLAHLALDTGATATVVNWDILVLLGYDPAVSTDRIQMTTGSGVEYVPRMEVSRLEALGKHRQKFSVICHTLPPSAKVDGLLGLDFFRGRRLVVDFRSGLIEVE